jgi:aryl-alcohol dehydrogenase-like predicted oxidoreductase
MPVWFATATSLGLVQARIGLGTAALTVPYGAPGADRPPVDARAARRTLALALDSGIDFIDTAPAYGHAEALVGEIAGARDCRIATKLAIPSGGWQTLDDRALRAAVDASVDRSRRALRRERLDVLQIHNATPELLARATLIDRLRELQADGIVGAVGASVYGEAAGLAAVATLDVVQVALSALDRRPEQRVLPAAVAARVEIVVRSALLRGVLSPAGRQLTGGFEALREAADAFRAAAGATWESMPQAAVAYAAGRPGVACVLLGPRDEVELRELLAGARQAPAVLAEGWQRELAPDLLDPSLWGSVRSPPCR